MGIIKSLRKRYNLRKARGFEVSDANATMLEMGKDVPFREIVWEEPNRANTPTLHIGKSGERYSTLTGVWWLDDDRFVVNHRSGLRVALFDLRREDPLVSKDETPHPTDDIAAKAVSNGQFEIAMSGCWSSICYLYDLRIEKDGAAKFELASTRENRTKDFAHGVSYDAEGRLCVALHTGKDPRILIADDFYRLPPPWGARKVSYDKAGKRYLAVTVSSNPRRDNPANAATAIWQMKDGSKDWSMIGLIDNVHSDSVDVFNGEIWLPDQVGDRLISLDADSLNVRRILHGDGFDFPHGLAISSKGKMAVTNYGSSSITFVDL